MRYISFTLIFFSVSVCANAQPGNKRPDHNNVSTPIPLDTAVHTGKLANGFTYFIRHNEEPKNRVVMYLANKAGSVLEDDDQRGLAHFMEHMSFNGTKHFPKNELVDYLQKSGIRFGADLNAYTSFDETVYQLPLPTDKPEILTNGILIMRDWAQDATLDPDEINKERGVVMEEKRLGKGSGERMSREYYPVLFNHSRYSDRLPIGLDTVLNNFTPEVITRFYKDWYRPDMQALIIVGDIDVNKMEQTIKAKFADLKNPNKEKPRTKYTIPLTGKNQFIAVTDKEMSSTQAQIFIKQQGELLKTEEAYRKTIVEELFNRIMSGRLSEISRQANPPFLGARVGVGDFLGGLNNFNATVTAKPGELESGFKALWREVMRAKKYGLTQTELDRAKANYLKTIENQVAEKNKTNSENYVKEYLQYFLRESASPGIEYEYKLVKRDLASISLQEVNEMVRESIKDADRDILLMAPEKDKSTLPDEAAFAKWMNAVEKENVTAYKDDVSKEPLIKVQPRPGKIISTQRDDKLGITTLILSNGVKVLVKKTDFKNDEIDFTGLSFGGTSLYPDSSFYSAASAFQISEYGVGNYNNVQLSKYMAGKQASVSLIIDERTQRIVGYTVNKDFETALQLVYAHIMDPRKDSTLFESNKVKALASLVNKYDNPNAVFLDTIIGVMGNHYFRRKTPTEHSINAVNLDTAFKIFKERFADASGFTFVFVGSMDTVALKPMLEKYLGSLPSLHKNEYYRDLHYHPPYGVIDRRVYKGTEQKATVQIAYTGKFPYSFENNIKLDAVKEALSIRMIERLREDESGVYSPQVLAGASKVDDGQFSLYIQFGCAPQNVDKLIASAQDEVARLIKNGPSEVNLQKFKAEAARQMETSQKTNSYWYQYLVKQLQNKDDLGEIINYTTVLNAVTIADVKQMAAQYLNGENVIKFILLPENK